VHSLFATRGGKIVVADVDEAGDAARAAETGEVAQFVRRDFARLEHGEVVADGGLTTQTIFPGLRPVLS
jgi:hypothetical protein